MVMLLTSLREVDGLFGKLQLKVARTYLSLLFRFVSIFYGFCCSLYFSLLRF